MDDGDNLMLGPCVLVVVETLPERSQAALNLQGVSRGGQIT